MVGDVNILVLTSYKFVIENHSDFFSGNIELSHEPFRLIFGGV